MRPDSLIGLGIALAAVVLAVGWVSILWRRDGQRFELMRLALEKGVSRFPNTPPFWLLSLRQGVTVLALGIALIGVGGGAMLITRDVPEPTLEQQMQSMPGQRPDQTRNPFEAHSDDRPPTPPDRQGGPDMPGPHEEMHPFPPPMPVPAVENWHRAQATRTIGLLSLGCGAVLLILGVVRIAFSIIERSALDENMRV